MNDLGPRIWRLMVEALQLAAADVNVQVASLPSYVNVADEVAETYTHPFFFLDTLVAQNLITDGQRQALVELDQMFAGMTRNKALWTLDSLRTAREWQVVRSRARQILQMMDQPVRNPDLSGTTYIPLDPK